MLVGPKKTTKYYANITRLKEKRALRVSLIAHTVHARPTPEKLDWPSRTCFLGPKKKRGFFEKITQL